MGFMYNPTINSPIVQVESYPNFCLLVKASGFMIKTPLQPATNRHLGAKLLTLKINDPIFVLPHIPETNHPPGSSRFSVSRGTRRSQAWRYLRPGETLMTHRIIGWVAPSSPGSGLHQNPHD